MSEICELSEESWCYLKVVWCVPRLVNEAGHEQTTWELPHGDT